MQTGRKRGRKLEIEFREHSHIRLCASWRERTTVFANKTTLATIIVTYRYVARLMVLESVAKSLVNFILPLSLPLLVHKIEGKETGKEGDSLSLRSSLFPNQSL